MQVWRGIGALFLGGARSRGWKKGDEIGFSDNQQIFFEFERMGVRLGADYFEVDYSTGANPSAVSR